MACLKHGCLIALLLTTSPALAEGGRTLSTGIVFPTAADAIAENPAALAAERAVLVGRLAYNDPAAGYVGMIASSGDTSGAGLALNAAGAGTLTLGGGWRTRTLHLGIDLNLNNTLNPADGNVGLGFLLGGPNGFRLGVTLSSILKSAADIFTLGLGYADAKDYQIELDLDVPTSSLSATGKPYDQTLSAAKYWQSFGLGVFETSPLGLKNFGIGTLSFGGVAQVKISGRTHVDFYYSTAAGGSFGFGFLAKL